MLNKIFENKLFGIEVISIGAPSLESDVMPVKAVLVNYNINKANTLCLHRRCLSVTSDKKPEPT